MIDKNLEKQRLRAEGFIVNNGIVLRTINLLREKYNKLNSVQAALKHQGIVQDEFVDSVNFLAEEGYLSLRNLSSKEPASIADTDFRELEAKVTGKGIRLLAGGIKDNMVEV